MYPSLCFKKYVWLLCQLKKLLIKMSFFDPFSSILSNLQNGLRTVWQQPTIIGGLNYMFSNIKYHNTTLIKLKGLKRIFFL